LLQDRAHEGREVRLSDGAELALAARFGFRAFRIEFVGRRIVSQEPVGDITGQKVIHNDMRKGLRIQETIPSEDATLKQLRGIKKKAVTLLPIRIRYISRLN
jgi:hypothetical protein